MWRLRRAESAASGCPPLRPDRQLTKRAALSESLRNWRQKAPSSELRASRKLSGHPRREPAFAQYWPFRANSRAPGRQP